MSGFCTRCTVPEIFSDPQRNDYIQHDYPDQLICQDDSYILVHFEPGQAHFRDAARSDGKECRDGGKTVESGDDDRNDGTCCHHEEGTDEDVRDECPM